MKLSDLSTNMLIAAREGHVIAARRHPRSNAIVPEPCIHHQYISDINKVLGPRLGHVPVGTNYSAEIAEAERNEGYKYN